MREFFDKPYFIFKIAHFLHRLAFSNDLNSKLFAFVKSSFGFWKILTMALSIAFQYETAFFAPLLSFYQQAIRIYN